MQLLVKPDFLKNGFLDAAGLQLPEVLTMGNGTSESWSRITSGNSALGTTEFKLKGFERGINYVL